MIWLRKGLCSILLFSSALTVASEPIPPRIQFDAEISGRTLLIEIANQEKVPASVEVFPGELATLTFLPVRAELKAGQKASLKVDLRGDLKDRQVVHWESKVLLEREVGVLKGPIYYQPFLLTAQGGRKLTYEDAFLKSREEIAGKSKVASIDLGGASYDDEIARQGFRAKELPSGAQVTPVRAVDPREYSKMPLGTLPKSIELGRGENRSLEDSFFDFQPEMNVDPYALVIKGRMSLKVAPNTYKAAWGWVVRAWQNVGGIWIFLGWDYVANNGAWQVSLAGAIPGVPVRIEYQTKNRFVSIQDAKGKPYTWGDNWALAGNVTDIGSRYADLTNNGDLPAVDKLYEGATQIWVKFYSLGMNALRNEPIQVFFPNSLASGKCIEDNGSGPYAWSCSYWGDGRIYIIPAHGSQSVVQHEIAHSINSYYWNGKMPSGSGGTHNLWDCYNNGLALTEGFANFLTYWVQFDRTQTAPSAAYFNMNLESLPAGVCANQTAEMRVAAAFWDMYDVHVENTNATNGDGLYYVSQAVPVSIYLGNKKNAMSEYLPVVQAGQSSAWQNEFARLFRLNKIVP
jgi:hypothetical protein